MLSRTEYISRPTGILEAAAAFRVDVKEVAAVVAMAAPRNSRRVRRLRLLFVMADILTRRCSVPKGIREAEGFDSGVASVALPYDAPSGLGTRLPRNEIAARYIASSKCCPNSCGPFSNGARS